MKQVSLTLLLYFFSFLFTLDICFEVPEHEDIQHNININTGAFGETRVKSMKLHWHQEEISNLSHTFDVIVASDW